MAAANQQTVEFRCPGEAYPISRAVHLGRLARFYPGCRQCSHREDTGTLSQKQVAQLLETRPRGLPRPLFHEEGAEGVLGNELDLGTARDMAAALGLLLKRRMIPEDAAPGAAWADRSRNVAPVVVIAGDGRPLSGELVAAMGEGLRWTGCHVVDVGPASAACLALAIDHLQASGGVLVGNRDDRPHTAGLKFWGAGPRPLSAGRGLDLLQQHGRAGVDRPGRSYGSLRRYQAESPYLDTLAEHYHALRPLRFVLHSSCGPLTRYLEKLTGGLACRILAGRTTAERLPEQVIADEAHFGVHIADDGETCHLVDEQGRRVPAERLLLHVARHLLTTRKEPPWGLSRFSQSENGTVPFRAPEVVPVRVPKEDPHRPVVLERGTTVETVRQITASGGSIVLGGVRRADVQQAMRAHQAILGGGPSGRFWYPVGGSPLPDALRTLTWLLVTLSQSDRRLSEVLDHQAAGR